MKNWAELLPPLPTLSDVFEKAQEEYANSAKDPGRETPPPQIVSLTEDDFNVALKGVVTEFTKDLTTGNIRLGFDAPAPTQTDESPEAPALADDEPQLSETDLDCYLTAAALRYTYRLDILTPIATATGPLAAYAKLSPVNRDALFAYLTGKSDIVKDDRGNARWLLHDDARRAALKTLVETGDVAAAIKQAKADIAAEQEAERTSRQNQTQDTVEQDADDSEETKFTIEDILWGYLSSQPLSLESPDSRQLILTQQVVKWLDNLSPKLTVPSPAAIARQLARETLLQPFRHLTGEWRDGEFHSYFVGREEELKRLYDYLDVLPPASLRDKLQRTYFKLTSSAWEYLTGFVGHRPLLIHGPGGVGKSTLLAQFLLDHFTMNPAAERFPYVYLDFDVSALNVREPVTLLAEAARQLMVQYPESEVAWQSARTEWLETISKNETDPVAASNFRVTALSQFADLVRQSQTEGVKVVEQFERKLPFLLVLDTFEEVQYHNRDDVKDVFRFLNAMSAELSALRVILMGRAPLDDLAQEFQLIESQVLESDHFSTGTETDFGVIEVLLGDLDTDTAKNYLANEGISDPVLAEDLIQALGANPLSLRLISKVVRKEKIDLSEMRKEIKWKPGISDRLFGRTVPPKQLLQGVLFRRILGHIHNDKIRDLAHPGLVLRRITPDLIQKVLAGPCGLGTLTDQEAKDYFDGLAKEVALVGTDRAAAAGEDVLKHRPELRRIMLRLMDADDTKTAQIQQVHENAISYYANRQGPVAREEELYHRLMTEDFPRTEDLLDDVPTEEAMMAGYVIPPLPENDRRPQWQALAVAVEELPIKANAYLEARLQRELIANDQWPLVDQRDWELMLLGRASRRARERDNVLSALESLSNDMGTVRSVHKRLTRFSPLPLIEIALMERARRFKEAVERARALRAELRTSAAWRLGFACALLAARAVSRNGDHELAEEFLVESQKRLETAYEGFGVRTADEIRLIRQGWRRFLRVTADCYLLTGTLPVFEILSNCLARISETGELEQSPVLLRYAVSAAVSNVEWLRPAFGGPPILAIARRPKTLSLLFTNLPRTSISKVSEALGSWTEEALQNRVDPNVFTLGRPPKAEKAVELYWRKLLLERPNDVSAQLPAIINSAPISDALLMDLLTALKPEPRTQGEDPFVEARTLGDLLPGEGPLIDPASASRKTRKRK